MNTQWVRQTVGAAILSSVVLGAAPVAAQTDGTSGARTVTNYWIEGGVGLFIQGSTPWENPARCSASHLAYVPASHPQFKSIHALVVQAMLTNRPIRAWFVQPCFTFWAMTHPVVHAIGIEP
ncbi:hypothetical protein IP84_07035 [beta proteobacterium AAP99]|nr:hypothetical protein IP84_07035 [beta proteobacterium AAP99]